jgi:branched-chain amino acid aminotransferase
MDLPMAPNMILKAIKLLLQYNQLSDAYVRVMVSRGEGPIGLDISLCPNPTVFIVTEQPHNYPTNWYQHGVSTVIVSHRHVPDISFSSSVKSCNYLVNIMARKEAQSKGAQEAIMLNMEGYITEGSVSNIFLYEDKKILTPALTSGILDGITRKTVIEIAEQRGIEVVERHISPEEIFSAEECFITNTTMEILPVTFCDGTQIGDGKPGRITKVLSKDYKRIVEEAVESEKD